VNRVEAKREYEAGNPNVERKHMLVFWYPDTRSRAPAPNFGEPFAHDPDAGDTYSVEPDGTYRILFAVKGDLAAPVSVTIQPGYRWVESFDLHREKKAPRPAPTVGESPSLLH
jgi:hypothetical protein